MSDSRNAPIDLYHRLKQAWSPDTGRKWRRDNPACGQCSVTALVVQDQLGGDILKTDVGGAWHFYNYIDGLRWDLTVSQFDAPVGYEDLPSNRDEAFEDTSPERYETLKRRVAEVIPPADRP
jgi:hypothetical protein